MNDPLSEVIALLQPRAVFSRRISGAGRWGVAYSAFGHPSFCAVLEGRCRLAVDGQRALMLEAGDFVLLPATPGFTMSGFETVRPARFDPKVTSATARALDTPTYGCSAAGSSSTRPMRQMHGQLSRSWTVAHLAKTAALSRSAFFERFTHTVGLPPMEYLLAWCMAVAKDLLRRNDFRLDEVAERVGYSSASTFSTAFSRHVGQPPSRYSRERRTSRRT
ncbi:MAG: AraC family transcriptional regulator [Acidobacteria bacterium]|nr:AraC family transcriptional regulator [Acidobacteriota bacterium]